VAGSTQGLLDNILGLAGDFAGGALRVSVKTNLGPEFEVGAVDLAGGGGSGSSSGGVSGLLGIRAAVILRDSQGRLVAKLGDPPATEPWRLLAAAGAALIVVLLIARGLRR
jgi:hypothetical protein